MRPAKTKKKPSAARSPSKRKKAARTKTRRKPTTKTHAKKTATRKRAKKAAKGKRTARKPGPRVARIDALTRKWVRGPADEIAVREGCRFDAARADHICEFYERFLFHTEGQWAGQLFTLLDWQRKDVLMPLFGWVRADGTRRFRIAYISTAKKNGKSTLVAGIALYLLDADNEPRGQVYIAASDREQASIVFRESAAMVEASPKLTERIEIIASRKRMISRASASFLQVLSSESRRQEGLNLNGLIFDELHAQPNRLLWDALRYGGSARREPLIVSITTAGFDRESICHEQYERAKRVEAGVDEAPEFFAYIRETSEEDPWTEPATWAKANPSLGTTIQLADLESDCQEAIASPSKENSFRRYRCNQWTQQDVRAIRMETWNACGGPIDESAFEGRECFCGLDLARTQDLSAFAKLFPSPDGTYDVLMRFWCDQDTAQARERRDSVPYLTWVRQGHLELTDGNTTDFAMIRKRIVEDGQRYRMREIAYDRIFAGELVRDLGEQDGFDMVPFGQGFISMAAPTDELDRLLLATKLRHGDNPILRWMASNLTVRMDPAGNRKPDKAKSTERIDGIVALIMALGRAIVTPELRHSEYEDGHGWDVI